MHLECDFLGPNCLRLSIGCLTGHLCPLVAKCDSHISWVHTRLVFQSAKKNPQFTILEHTVWDLARYYYLSNSALRFGPDCLKLEGLFAWLEMVATSYNSLTTKQKPLLVIRLLAAIFAVYIAVKMFYSGW